MEMRDEFVVSVLFIPLTATRSSPTLGEQLPSGLSVNCPHGAIIPGWKLLP